MEQPLFQIKQEKRKANYGKFVLSPLAAGYGNTLGTALRRVLLTSLPGTAITRVKITGVRHQFSSLKGMREDIVEFILNLKKVRLEASDDKPFKLTLSVKSAGEVKAGDIQTPATVTVANPDLVLANLSKDSKLDANMRAESGTGYSPATDQEVKGVGQIPLDATFSPVTRVNFKVEETRVGRLTNYDRLTIDIWTDGTINPKSALIDASEIIVTYFNQIISPKKPKVKKVEPKGDDLGSVGNLSVEEIGLPTRVANALIKTGFETVDKLAGAKKEDIMKVRNLGEKSIKIIRVALAEKGVEFLNE